MRVIVSLCLVVVLAACGVRGQSDAHVFDDSEVPYGLTETSTSTAPPAVGEPFNPTTTASIPFELYFIKSGAGILVPVTRRAGSVPSASEVVTKLVQGPTDAEVNAGHRSAITSVDIVTRTRESGASVTVDLARTFNDIPRGDRILALGQLTLTLTALPDISLVQYTIADQPIEVPKANGVVTKDPVNRSDYSALLVPPSSSTSTPTTTAVSASIGPGTSG